ncbi:MAG: hypothetical protein K2K39_02040, partial [Clostridia bacterium]|nr:hypothetical protein [Clostridia bacterium]
GEEKPFINVVKIKSLLSLLFPAMQHGKIVKKLGEEYYPNESYFYESQHFPKFFFPAKCRNLENFPALIEEGRTFIAEGYTPQKVCKAFFSYAREIVLNGAAEIERRLGLHFDEMKLALVHPLQTGKRYVEELTNLVKTAFGKVPAKVMNCGRALSMFAKERGVVESDDEILIFDMGEDTLSVLKCFINDDGKVVVEPAADHSAPVIIGGNDVDFCIADSIERSIARRETVGSPSYGEAGHIYEEGLQSKQYLFLKEIKKAKLLLSIPALKEVFAGGVPVSLHRDLYLQLRLTREQLEECVGIPTDNGVAKDVLDYVSNELALDVNSDVKKVFLTGGLVETCGLVDYIKRGVAEKFGQSVTVSTFEDNMNDGDPMVIQTYEDSVYAPSVGAAIVALKDYEVSAGLTYSYGTWLSLRGARILQILVGRGHTFDENSYEKLFERCALQGTVKEEFFSVRLSKSTIERRKYEGEVTYLTSCGKKYLCIGMPNTPLRKQIEKRFQLKTLTGPNARIVCSYYGRIIESCEPKLVIAEGIATQPNSDVMRPFVEKSGDNKRKIRVYYHDGGTATVAEKNIEVKLVGVTSIEGEKS